MTPDKERGGRGEGMGTFAGRQAGEGGAAPNGRLSYSESNGESLSIPGVAGRQLHLNAGGRAGGGRRARRAGRLAAVVVTRARAGARRV